MRDEFLEPIMTMNPPAPKELLFPQYSETARMVVFCDVDKGKQGCAKRNEQACLNASPYQRDVNKLKSWKNWRQISLEARIQRSLKFNTDMNSN